MKTFLPFEPVNETSQPDTWFVLHRPTNGAVLFRIATGQTAIAIGTYKEAKEIADKMNSQNV